MQDALPSTTLLFSDIEGSTRLWEQHPDRMPAALAAHDAALRVSVERNRGTVVKTTGDGLLASFVDAADAAKAALDLQQAVSDLATAHGIPLRVRCGLHAGVAEWRANDYYGPAVNRAARIMAVAHGGQTLLSQVVVDRARGLLPPDAVLRDLGKVRLRDLATAEHVYQLACPGLRDEFPALRSLEITPNNLPQQVTSFVGRERELAEVQALLLKSRLVTLLGVGGLGKTRLALQVGAEVLDDYSDGVWFVDLAPLTDERRVAQAIAAVLGVKEEAEQALPDALRQFVTDRQLLLVFDNCEHLMHGCARMAAELLQSGPRSKVVATSREPLHIAGEILYALPSLSLPDPRSRSDPSELTQFEAIRLFLDRAVAAQPAFRLTELNADAIVDICHRLDGIPLAIELAAARVRALAVAQIDARLGDRFRLLRGGDRTALPRQQTLRACIDWSYELLVDAEKRLLERLSVFGGGWSLSAAEIVCADDEVADGDVLDLLTSLHDKSLVVAEQRSDAVRYRLLETVRQYALEKLDLRRGRDPVRRRHGEYFLALAEEAEPKMWGAEQGEWLQCLEADHENLRGGLEWSFAQANPEQSLRYCVALQRFWIIRAHFREGREACARVLDKAKGSVPRHELARLLSVAGTLAYHQSDHPAAHALHHQSLALHRELGDRQRVAVNLTDLGLVAHERGNLAEGRALHQESLALMRELGNKGGIAAALNNLAGIAHQQGDFAAARAMLEEGLAIKRELGDPGRIASSLGNLANIALDQGDLERARTLFEECLDTMRKIGNRGFIATTLESLGRIACFEGDYPRARRLSEESLTIMRELQHSSGIADALYNLGNVACNEGEYAAALAMFREGLAIRRERGDRPAMASLVAGAAAVHAAAGDGLRAARIWGAAEHARAESGLPLARNERVRHEARMQVARAVLGDDAAFDRALEEGRALTLEGAVELATGPATALA